MSRNSASEKPTGKLPPEIHADLVETLFGTVGSMLSGVFGGLLVPIIALFRTGDTIFAWALGITLAISAIRIAVLFAYRRTPPEVRRASAHRWECIYALGGVGFMATVGITAAILLAQKHDELTALYGVVIVLGCAGSLAGRNAGRPAIVLGQILGVCGPVAAVFLWQFDAWYWGLAVIFGLVLISVKSTTRFLNGMLVSALLSSREARMQKQRLATAMNAMSHGLCMTDRDGIVSVANDTLAQFFQIEGEIRGLTFEDLATRIANGSGMSETATGQFVSRLGSQIATRAARACTYQLAARTFLFRSEPMENGGAVIVVEDATDATKAAEQVKRLAHFDAVTDLPNRTLFRGRLQEALTELRGRQLALMAVDLDRFKEVNDTLGHPMGDKLLKQVAERLQVVVGARGLVSRFGGDEFLILIQSQFDDVELDRLAGSMIAKLSAPYSIEGNIVSVGASIGIAVAPNDAREADELAKRADMSLYAAKAVSPGTFRRFTPEMENVAQRKREMEQELRHALTGGQLEIHYQPIVDERTRTVLACEALMRWRHPVKGFISPAEFIPIAEDTGLIVELGEFVLRQACQDALGWPDHVKVAVNVSSRQFLLRSDLHERVLQIVDRIGLPRQRLELEITEGTLVTARDSLKLLAEAGVRVSLDDFGTGYSSLSYLRQFPVDKIKIDRSFVINYRDPVSLAVIAAVRSLATALDIDLVAEGIEDTEQLEALSRIGVHQIQGYLFSKPKPLAELTPFFGEAAQSTSKAKTRAA